MLKKLSIILLLSFAGLTLVFGQERPRAALLDATQYNSLPRKATQLTRSLQSLPRAASLKQFAPYPGDQGAYGTCVAWATGYAARTIAESVILNRQDRNLTTTNVFSPVFIYKSISNDPSCETGTSISNALELMKNPGVPRRNTTERSTDFKTVPLSTYQQSDKFPIGGYVTLYSTPRGETGYDPARIQAVKKSISEGKPVIIGMNTPSSFDRARDLWQPLTANPNINYGGHAMCVVGYDDDKYGGAFEIQNSWGVNWGNQGYIWIRYEDFARFVSQAFEMIENLDSYRDAALYSGFVNIVVQGSNNGMPVRFDASGYYKTVSSYSSGTQFRFIMGNNHPAYVYAFTADSSTTTTNLIFPLPELNESPVLDYAQNMVAFPSENDWMQMDDVTGTDYLVVLFCKQELDINAIRARFATATGTFPQRVARAVGSDFIPYSSVNYESSNIAFSGTMMNKRAIMGLLLAIDHKAPGAN